MCIRKRLVSIHALTRRATINSLPHGKLQWFQSTPSRGGRQQKILRTQHLFTFQSTPSRGGRLVCSCHWVIHGLFQSTPSRGGRHTLHSIYHVTSTFQSTPSRGGRPCRRTLRWSAVGFNPRPHAEGDSLVVNRAEIKPVSIHALTRRATDCDKQRRCFKMFQSTPSRGGRHNLQPNPLHTLKVSIHALTRRATLCSTTLRAS